MASPHTSDTPWLRPVMVVNELRSESVHARFLQLFEEHFTIKKVPQISMQSYRNSSLEARSLSKRPAIKLDSICKAFETSRFNV